ncbi:MAG: 3,4-dihydroxy-2-butanone-4-phosphate synthase [Solirubrobacterales bacterium]
MTPDPSPIEGIVDRLAHGEMIVVHGDAGAGPEGHVVMAAAFASAEAVNFMAKEARGLISLGLTFERCKALGIEAMERRGESRLGCGAMVSIEAREGVTTGISAADRARTIKVAVDPGSTAADLVRPGHVFPIRTRPHGVLDKPSPVEAAVDLVAAAGLEEAAILCQVIRDDGHSAGLDDLREFAAAHGLPSVSADAVAAYRRQAEPAAMPVDRKELRDVMGHFATGVSVITSRGAAGRPVGTTANAVSSVSLEPPLILICLAKDSETLQTIRASGRFAVNILSFDQRHHSDRFATKGDAAQVHEVKFDDHDLGVPVIPGALATIACEVDAIHRAGDHEIVIGAVRGLDRGDGGQEPLLFFKGGYSRIVVERDELAG